MCKLCNDNCLAVKFPEIAAEWHPNKNGNLTPYDIIAGTHQKYWWRCKKGHEWQADPHHRIAGRGCPYCVGKKVCNDNCLAVLFPEIAVEWHPNKNGNLTTYDVTGASNKKVWWQCGKGHEWLMRVHERTLKKQGCPYCARRRVCLDNCFATTHPELVKQWNYNKNGNLTPFKIVSGSNKRVWWRDEKGHEWQASANARTLRHTRCPYCANQKACNDNCLAILFPEIAAEWHPTKNGNLTPYDVMAGSDNKVWWQCKNGHEYLSSIGGRTGKCQCGCPICNESKGEKNIAKIFEKLNIRFKRQWRFKSCKNILSLPFDFVVKTNNGIKIIEYQGEQHYKPIKIFGGKEKFTKLQKHDSIKKEWCKKRNVHLLVIPYWEYKNLEFLLKEFIQYV